MKSPNKYALVEIGDSHDECLLSQMHALSERGVKILLCTTQKIVDRNPLFVNYVDSLLVVDMNQEKSKQKREISRIWNKIKAEKCSKVVLNTAQGNMIRYLCWKALFSKIEFVGILHTTRKLKGSFTQKMISKKVKKYLFLSEYLLSTLEIPKELNVDYFYPLRFNREDRSFKKTGLQIAIIGGVENRRKDLDGFVEMAGAVKDQNIDFVFVGKSDLEKRDVHVFLNKIEKKELQNIRYFTRFVSQDEFDIFVSQSDLILPMIHPDTPSADQYFKNQISGAMTVSFAYKIPMLVHREFKHISEMKPAGFYYEPQKFAEALNSCLDKIEQKRKEMRDHQKYSVEYQENRYADFVMN